MLPKIQLFLEKTHCYLTALNKVRLIALFILINSINSISFSMLSRLFTNGGLREKAVGGMSAINEFLLAVILAPIIETLIFQYAIIETVRQKTRPIYACLLSATAFALLHSYSIFYFLYALVSGLLFAYLYYLEKSEWKSFVIVLSAHCLYNLLTFMVKFI